MYLAGLVLDKTIDIKEYRQDKYPKTQVSSSSIEAM